MLHRKCISFAPPQKKHQACSAHRTHIRLIPSQKPNQVRSFIENTSGSLLHRKKSGLLLHRKHIRLDSPQKTHQGKCVHIRFSPPQIPHQDYSAPGGPLLFSIYHLLAYPLLRIYLLFNSMNLLFNLIPFQQALRVVKGRRVGDDVIAKANLRFSIYLLFRLCLLQQVTGS